jgi:hypothetical protein
LSLEPFITASRIEIEFDDAAVRHVYRSEIARVVEAGALEDYMSERIPTYYRDPAHIAADLAQGYFLRAIADTLARLPTAETFRDSHFGELLASEFAVAALGLRLLYSKLRLLTAENANAYKMDIMMYDPSVEPVELVLLEVKSSVKTATDAAPGHDKSIYSSLFASLRKYAKADLSYDLTAARDRMGELPEDDRERLAQEFARYGGPKVRYAGVCSIDLATHVEAETSLLATRKSVKDFEVDLLCVVEFAQVVESSFAKLSALRDAAC